MHTYDAHWPPYFISSSGVMQFREACYTVVSYAPYILLQIYTITLLATFRVTIFEFFHPGPQPNTFISAGNESVQNANVKCVYVNTNALSCQPRVTVTSCFVYKVIMNL